MLEEASYANHKADYFWLLVQSAGMLLVRLQPLHETPSELTAVLNIGIVTTCEPSLSLLSDVGAHPTYVTPAAFFLTAHFSQEDYPYDWCVFSNSARLAYSRNSTPSPAGSCTGSRRCVSAARSLVARA